MLQSRLDDINFVIYRLDLPRNCTVVDTGDFVSMFFLFSYYARIMKFVYYILTNNLLQIFLVVENFYRFS
jgi:hypothetical protein